mmetsp:Transcript_32374/g.68109  ORF Transcript_32374/g.68109 Transcript_32374/m.68109 type:complete len:560 (-) Transcript_32374:140-1819(-)|eukprot:CAMPEP_0172297412 /NCGR_PEP_ID=MMETSP1058-20130122/446_1 /TAXON_ID=83371 /ORGANISM="Detonula confervacea, Strain CCMP 353" /LENGTH=559 /DNA_ID=CAMNT_0013006563 /DNA_START=108 /DNA_END=1787 /DNA_ORIENTATION=-
MSNDAKNDLFGDSSSDADTDDLIAAAKSQPIARKKESAPAKKKASKKNTPDADADSDFDEKDDDDAGLFDSSSEDEAGPKKKQLGKKRKAAAGKKKPAAAKKPAKKDTRSMKERMEALARRRAEKSGDGGEGKGRSKEPKKKRSKRKDGEEGGDKESGYKSGDSYDSETFQRNADDDEFIDADDEDPDALKELYAEQHFEDERPDSDSEDERKQKKMAGGRKTSGGAGLDKINLSDDEGGEMVSASSALKAAVKRMQRKKKETKKLPELEEEGIAFLKKMEAAAEADAESVKNKRPGLKKLGMLQEVMDMLAKKDMVRVLLDLDLLSTVKRWVQPLPNGTLGNVTLRRRIMESIAAMTGENGINAHDLKQSGFGKVVMTLYMHKSETPEMKKMLKGTIEQWSRPIFQKSGNMRDLERAQAARGMNETGSMAGMARARQMEDRLEERRAAGGRGKRGKNTDDLAQIITKGSKASDGAGSNRVRIPYSKGFQYTVRPENRMGDVSDKRNLVSAKGAGAAGAGFRDTEKRDAMSKRMLEKNRKTNKQSQRSANISIEGRAVK